MNKQFEVLPPAMPNFVHFKTPPRRKEEGFKPQEGYDIVNFDEREAKEYAQLMAATFMDHWHSRVKTLKDAPTPR